MKKLLSVILTAIIAVAFTACNENAGEKPQNASTSNTTTNEINKISPSPLTESETKDFSKFNLNECGAIKLSVESAKSMEVKIYELKAVSSSKEPKATWSFMASDGYNLDKYGDSRFIFNFSDLANYSFSKIDNGTENSAVSWENGDHISYDGLNSFSAKLENEKEISFLEETPILIKGYTKNATAKLSLEDFKNPTELLAKDFEVIYVVTMTFYDKNLNDLPQIASVDGVLEAPEEFEGKTVILRGSLPQAMTYCEALEKEVPVIYNIYDDPHSKYIILEGEMPDFGSCEALVTGKIRTDGDLFFITAEKYEKA